MTVGLAVGTEKYLPRKQPFHCLKKSKDRAVLFKSIVFWMKLNRKKIGKSWILKK